MENSTTITNNKTSTSFSKGKERSGENVPTMELQPSHPCIGRGDRKRTSEVSSGGVVGQGAHHPHPFHMTTFGEEKKLKARIARSTRQMERQKGRNSKITSSVYASTASPTSNSTRSRKANHTQSSAKGYEEHHHPIYTHDNVKLIFVLKKVLTSSDVNDQGRIVLPKKEAEESLPKLHIKAGTLFIMREVLSNTEWQLTYRYWANHKGRIYVLYNCGEFVNKNMLKAGDTLTLYQDIFKNNFFTITKKENHIPRASNEHVKEEEIGDEEEEGEAIKPMSSHTYGSYSTNRSEDMPVFIRFI